MKKKPVRIGWKVVRVEGSERLAILKMAITGKVITPYQMASVGIFTDRPRTFNLVKRRTNSVTVLASALVQRTRASDGRARAPRISTKYRRFVADYDRLLKYETGQTTEDYSLDENRRVRSGRGIHFFDTRNDALVWALWMSRRWI